MKLSLLKSLFGSPLDGLVIAIPIVAAVKCIPQWRNQTALFFLAGCAIIPLAGWMGRATEQLADRTSPGIGGLLNASFGNAAELIIALIALSKGLVNVVKASITGSILSNLLLILGISAFAGGVRFRVQQFNQAGARIAATALTLAAIGLVVPTIFHVSADSIAGGWSPRAEQKLSVSIAVVLIVTYGIYLVFSLITHRELFGGNREPNSEGKESATFKWPVWWCITVLAASAALVGWLSEILVGSIEAARESLGLTEVFVGVVIVAIVGNAAEHATAVAAAMKNRMALSIGIAFGSSMQVALLVTPVLIFASYGFGQPMTLEFSLPEIAGLGLAIWIAGQISGDGETNWMEGVQLVSVYLIIGILFYFLP